MSNKMEYKDSTTKNITLSIGFLLEERMKLWILSKYGNFESIEHMIEVWVVNKFTSYNKDKMDEIIDELANKEKDC